MTGGHLGRWGGSRVVRCDRLNRSSCKYTSSVTAHNKDCKYPLTGVRRWLVQHCRYELQQSIEWGKDPLEEEEVVDEEGMVLTILRSR